MESTNVQSAEIKDNLTLWEYGSMEEWKNGRMEVNFLHPPNVNPACQKAGVLRQLYNPNCQQPFISSNGTLRI